MITFRREYLDAMLEANLAQMRGKVLDIGGRKNKKRGRFRPPLGQVECWKYVNPDPAAEPDIQGAAEALPVSDGAYDLVVLTEVLEYVKDPRQTLKEARRVLVDGGLALISVPLHSPVHGDFHWDHFRFTKSGLKLLLEEASFREFTISEMGGFGAVLFDLLEAATGYANPGERALFWKILRKFLYLSVPLFRALDSFFGATAPYVTTGYFISARK